jgi:hypothetical protein
MDDNEQDDVGAPKALNLDDPEVAARWNAAEIPTQKIRHALALGLKDLARRHLTSAEHLMRNIGCADRLEDTALAQVDGLDLRILNALEEHCEAITIGDLLQVPAERIIAVPNMAERQLYKMLASLLKHTIHTCRALEAKVADLEQRRRP